MLSLVDVVGGKSAKQTGDSKPGDSTPLGNSTLSPSTGSADSDVILKPPPTHGTSTAKLTDATHMDLSHQQ